MLGGRQQRSRSAGGSDSLRAVFDVRGEYIFRPGLKFSSLKLLSAVHTRVINRSRCYTVSPLPRKQMWYSGSADEGQYALLHTSALLIILLFSACLSALYNAHTVPTRLPARPAELIRYPIPRKPALLRKESRQTSLIEHDPVQANLCHAMR
jgi:hypothetical protein